MKYLVTKMCLYCAFINTRLNVFVKSFSFMYKLISGFNFHRGIRRIVKYIYSYFSHISLSTGPDQNPPYMSKVPDQNPPNNLSKVQDQNPPNSLSKVQDDATKNLSISSSKGFTNETLLWCTLKRFVWTG